MLTLENLINIINSTNRWEVIELLYNENGIYFQQVNEIYNACSANIHLVGEPYEYALLLVHATIGLFYWVGLKQMHALLEDTEFSHEEHMARASADTYKVFIKKTKIGLDFYTGTLMKTLGLGELMFFGKNYLYKSEEFQELFSNRVATFIYKEFQEGNLSPEFVSFLLSLC